jgi:predicted transcriptional regulator
MGKNATITFRISEEFKERLEELAAKRDIPVSQLIREYLKEYLSKES